MSSEEFITVYKSLYLSKFLALSYGISFHFSETLMELAVRMKICKWLYLIVLKSEKKMMENAGGNDHF